MNILKSKTFWTGITGILSAGAGYATGEFSTAASVQLAINSAMGIFIRMAIAKEF